MRNPALQYRMRLEELTGKIASSNIELINYKYEVDDLEKKLATSKALHAGAARKLSGLVGLMNRLMVAPGLDSWGLPSYGNRPGVIPKKEWEEKIKVLGPDD